MANLCCLIDTEPRTLSQEELNLVREVASDAVRKMEVNASFNSRLFYEMQGFKQAIIMEESELQFSEDVENQVQNSDECKKNTILGRPCQCILLNTKAQLEISQNQSHLKEPLSAPF